MDSDLIEHAIKNVWCTPGMDKQVTLQLVRLSEAKPAKGRLTNTTVDLPLPDSHHYFHCYYIGQIPPDRLGVFPLSVWTSLPTLAEDGNCLFHIYQYDCLEICRGKAFLYTNERNEMLLALQTGRECSAPDHLFFRIYKNTFYESPRADEGAGIVMATWTGVEDFYSFFKEVAFYKELSPKSVFLTANGYTYNDFVPDVMNEDAHIDMVYDPSIASVSYYPYSELKTYYSPQAQVYRFLLCPQETMPKGLFFYDDIDCYIIKPIASQPGVWQGVRLPVLAFESIAQVTHQAWGISINLAEGLRERLFQGVAPEQLALCLVTRQSGYDRPLIYEANKLQALYRLPPALRREALLGIDSLVEQWQASVLEDSAYVQLMSSPPAQFTFDRVLSAYGYHGLCKALYDTPSRVQNGQARKSRGYQRGVAVAVEYDSEGLLLSVAMATPGATYQPSSVNVALVEFLSGRLTRTYYSHFDDPEVQLRESTRFQVYTMDKATGAPPTFRNITDTPDCFVEQGRLYYRVDRESFHTFVIYEEDIFYAHEILSEEKGYLDCTLRLRVTDQLTVNKGIFCEKYWLWLNNRALIENVDFLWIGSQVRIISKRYLRPKGRPNTLTLIGYGLPETTPLPSYQDTGFVQWQRLSFNKRYDYRDDQLLRYLVGGRVYSPERLSFAEDGVATIDGLTLSNGLPYRVESVHPLLSKDLSLNPENERRKADIIDEKVQNYLTLKCPEQRPDEVSAIPEKYPLYSPYLAQVLTDGQSGVLPPPSTLVTDEALAQALTPYDVLLAQDPCLMTSLDLRYLAIHPHRFQETVSVSKEDYRLLERVVQMKLNNKVDLSFFLTIREN